MTTSVLKNVELKAPHPIGVSAFKAQYHDSEVGGQFLLNGGVSVKMRMNDKIVVLLYLSDEVAEKLSITNTDHLIKLIDDNNVLQPAYEFLKSDVATK